MRRIYIIPEGAEPRDYAPAAKAAGANEVAVGIPPALAHRVAGELPQLVEADPLPASLGVDRVTIPADGTAEAVVTYWSEQPDAPATVTFDVNGAQVTEDLVDQSAAIAVTADAPGPVTVACEGLTVTLEAQEAPV